MNARRLGWLLAAWSACAACGSTPAGHSPATDAASTALAPRARVGQTSRADDLAAFDQVWTTIRDQHWDPTLGGLDWNAVRDELRPRVLNAQNGAQARTVLQEMLRRLGQSHFAILPAEAVELLQPEAAGRAELDAAPGGEGVTGLQVRPVGDAVLVTQIDAQSPAFAGGIGPGWEVLRIGDADVRALVRRLREAAGDGVDAQFHLARALQQRLQGPVGGRLAVSMRDARGEVVTRDLPLIAPPGEMVTFGNLPATRVWLSSRWVQPPENDGRAGLGLIAFNAFLDPARLMQEFSDAVRTFQQADGIVLDLRGNPGGIGAMAMGMAGFFVADRDRYLGTMITRQTRLRFVVNPRTPAYSGPLAVLVDALTASTGEILAAGLSDMGRARVFGQRSAGMALPSLLTVLPNGDGFQYAFASYETSKGAVLEGNGVVPDQPVALTRERLLQDGDATLAAAVEWCRQQPGETP